MSDTKVPAEEGLEIRKAVKLLQLREAGFEPIKRLALEMLISKVPEEVMARAKAVLEQENEIFEVEAEKRRAKTSDVGKLKPDTERDSKLTEHLQGTARAQGLAREEMDPGRLPKDSKRDSMLTEHLQGTGRAPGLGREQTDPGELEKDHTRDSNLTEHLQGTGRAPSPKEKLAKPKKLDPSASSPEVKRTVAERSTLQRKGEELGVGAQPDSMREMIGDEGVLEGLMSFFEGVDSAGEFDGPGVMKAVRLSVALGKSEEAKEFLAVARENKDDVKRLMANRPDDFKKLLAKGEFAAMKVLVEQEIKSPSTKLIGGPSGAHQFHEHGAHNSAIQLILLSLDSGNPKSSWESSAKERLCVEWAEKKIANEIQTLAAGNAGGPDSIGWKGPGMAAAAQVIADNLNYPNPADRWTGPGGIRPTSWAHFVGDSETFRSPTTFRWRHPNGSVGGTKNVGPVFNRNISELNASGANAGAAGNLASRKIKATQVALAGPPPHPLQFPLLDDPATTLTQGSTYFYEDDAGQWKKITLVVYQESPPITTFKAVFRKTTDANLTYKVYTAYPA